MTTTPLPTSESAPAIFIYGTLLDKDILRAVLGRNIADNEYLEAEVFGVAKYTYPGDSFPILKPQLNSKAQGAVLFNLSTTDLDRINFYEGDEYGFVEIEAQLADGRKIAAQYNAATDQQIDSQSPWLLSDWQRDEKARFLGYTQRYMAQYNIMSIDQADALWRSMVDNHSDH